MEVGGRLRRRRSLQERLGLVCCGSTWGGEVDDLIDPPTEPIPTPPESNSAAECVFPSARMNLAAALEAERQSRSTAEAGALTEGVDRVGNTTPSRVSLMRLLEETDDQDEKEGAGDGDRDLVCCVCMRRKKGAAFIPCGHTFCRVCSRELWLNRGSCPLCNRSILEILDIF